MQASFRFFSNKNCAYFPCHAEADREDFNCLFCFCPLYFFADCGGSPRYMQDETKDCSHCRRVHVPEGFDFVLERLRQNAGKERRMILARDG